MSNKLEHSSLEESIIFNNLCLLKKENISSNYIDDSAVSNLRFLPDLPNFQ